MADPNRASDKRPRVISIESNNSRGIYATFLERRKLMNGNVNDSHQNEPSTSGTVRDNHLEISLQKTTN